MSSTNRTITIGGEEYNNVTLNWTPRVSLVGGIFAMAVPTVFALVSVTYYFFQVEKDGVNVAEEVVKSFKINKRLLYLKDHVTIENYEDLKTKDDHIALDKGHNKYNKFQIDGVETRLPDPLDKRELSPSILHQVHSSRFKTARKFRKTLFGKLTLTRPCGLLIMMWIQVLQPTTVIVWGIMDVLADTFYFYQLERGQLLDSTITRNIHVNNGILVFAVLGALMASYGGYCYFIVLLMNEDESNPSDRAKVIKWTIQAACCKILFEDAPELILEYFYVDKYVVENQPWYLIMKDVITAVIYILPLVKVVKTMLEKKSSPDHVVLRRINGKEDVFMYIYVTCARVMMSFAMIFRIVGMIIQYTSSTIDKDCLEVMDGKLIQTPFSTGCLKWCDWCILLSFCLLLFNVLIPIFPFLLSEYIG